MTRHQSWALITVNTRSWVLPCLLLGLKAVVAENNSWPHLEFIFQINHKPDKYNVFGSLTWLVNVTERPLSNWKWSPGGHLQTSTHFKSMECVEIPCLRATHSLTRLGRTAIPVCLLRYLTALRTQRKHIMPRGYTVWPQSLHPISPLPISLAPSLLSAPCPLAIMINTFISATQDMFGSPNQLKLAHS